MVEELERGMVAEEESEATPCYHSRPIKVQNITYNVYCSMCSSIML